MKPQGKAKEQDCHTKAIIEALKVWHDTGKGENMFICGRGFKNDLIERAGLFLKGGYPTLYSKAMSNVSLGNSLDGKQKGLGFSITYVATEDLKGTHFDILRGTLCKVTVLEEAMLGHVLTHGEHEELKLLIEHTNAKFEAR